MKRRDFLKYASSVASTSVVPVGLSMNLLAQRAYAASPVYSNVEVAAPTVMPQVINIFMYGGASELAGNLSNIAEINMHSQNDYTANKATKHRTIRSDPANRHCVYRDCFFAALHE